MEDELLNKIICSENSVLVREFCQVMGSLWVICSQRLVNDSVLLLLSQLFLVHISHLIVLVEVHQILIVFKVFTNTLLIYYIVVSSSLASYLYLL